MTKELERLIKKNGFVLKRNGKHRVYQDERGQNFVTANTPSDHRAELNIKKELKRVTEKAGRSYVSEDEPRREKVQFNTPKIVQAETKPAIKMIDDEAVRVMVEGFKDKWPLARTEKALEALGYRMASGRPLAAADISRELVSRGYRRNKPREFATAPKPKAGGKRSAFLQELTDLLTSNLEESLKERMAIMLVRSRIEPMEVTL